VGVYREWLWLERVVACEMPEVAENREFLFELEFVEAS
jgi:hypothetical protein